MSFDNPVAVTGGVVTIGAAIAGGIAGILKANKAKNKVSSDLVALTVRVVDIEKQQAINAQVVENSEHLRVHDLKHESSEKTMNACIEAVTVVRIMAPQIEGMDDCIKEIADTLKTETKELRIAIKQISLVFSELKEGFAVLNCKLETMEKERDASVKKAKGR